MQLLIMLLALAFRHWWGSPNPVQHDSWFNSWLRRLDRYDSLNEHPPVRLAVAIGLPALAVFLVIALLQSLSVWLLLPFGVLILLYSFGRLRPAGRVDAYNSAYACEDWELASSQAALLGVDMTEIAQGDWVLLNERTLAAASYRGFEALFAVLFWFVLLGPLGALVYRLSYMYRTAEEADDSASYWLWLIEWPAVRVFGLSLAVTGNFASCFRAWQRLLMSESIATGDVTYRCVQGALSASDEEAPLVVGRRELSGHLGLYYRTFWLWVGVLSAWAILV